MISSPPPPPFFFLFFSFFFSVGLFDLGPAETDNLFILQSCVLIWTIIREQKLLKTTFVVDTRQTTDTGECFSRRGQKLDRQQASVNSFVDVHARWAIDVGELFSGCEHVIVDFGEFFFWM